MERFVNILLITDDLILIGEFQEILKGSNSNLLIANNEGDVWEILNKQRVGIILINSTLNKSVHYIDLLKKLKLNVHSKESYFIIVDKNNTSEEKLINTFKKGAVDYITFPFNPQLVRAKIQVYKKLHFKDLRIMQLLENIFPKNVLFNLNTVGKFSPRKIDEGVVLFTDFVAFTKSAQELSPMELIKKLEKYFNKFDEILTRYNLEKIKTIGDAYMALGGVTEDNREPAVRATLAAIEIRDYVRIQNAVALATNEIAWKIRIGIHTGPLVAGIISTKKISFDIWGDTVNIAARAEQNSTSNNITITEQVKKRIDPYFNIEKRGEIAVKNGGKVTMYFVHKLKDDLSMFNNGRLPNSSLRMKCDLPPMDFDYVRRYIINKLKASLPDKMEYHNIEYTLALEEVAIRIAKIEGVQVEDMILLRTAALFRSTGFIYNYKDNDVYGVKLAQAELPKYGYDRMQIKIICSMINATSRNDRFPTTLLEKILCDAEHDYLGRADYHFIARNLRKELAHFDKNMTELEWVDFQLNFLENQHRYYTITSKNMREKGKEKRIKELKTLRKEFL